MEDITNALASETTRQNEFYTSDFHYAIQISVYLLKPIGAWPLFERNISIFKVALHKLSMVVVTFFHLFIIVPCIVYIVEQNLGLIMALRLIGSLILTVTVSVKYLLLLWHQDKLKSCVNHVADDWRYTTFKEDREIMLANAKLGRTFGLVSLTFMYGCGLLFFSMPLVLNSIFAEGNNTVRLHPMPCEFVVFDSKVSPAYEIVYCMQSLGGISIYNAFCGICSLMAHFVTHICSQCDILSSFFEETVDGGKHNSGPIDIRIATAISRHLRLLKLVSNVSGLFTEICLVEFINASCNICLFGYFIILDINNHESFLQIFVYIFALSSVIFNLFIFCYIGDLLTESCQMVGTICYTTQWYRMPPRKAIEMIMPIAISRYPTAITAGKMMTMTLSTFSDILKTSMAYFNLLREFS